MRADDKPDRDGDEPCEGVRLPKPRPSADGDALRPEAADLEVRRLALALRHSLLAA